MEYSITYTAQNTYETPVVDALWQFLITPQENDSQSLRLSKFSNDLHAPVEETHNAADFPIYRVRQRKAFKSIGFEAHFVVRKDLINAFSPQDGLYKKEHYESLKTLDFRIEFEPFLKETELTNYPKSQLSFDFVKDASIFDNLQNLNTWIFTNFIFKKEVTDTHTTTLDFVKRGAGVCQDFTHLFLAIARKHGIPARYTSGYLHQGIGYKGASQMHAWAECYLPEKGWLGYDPANNLIALENHIKVAHGRDYRDCAPIKGVLHSASSKNTTVYSVGVVARDEQAPDVFDKTDSKEFRNSETGEHLDFQIQGQKQQQQ